MPTYNDLITSQLVINLLTKTQFDAAVGLDPAQEYHIDPEFVGNKLLQTSATGDIVESDDVPTTIQTLSATDSITLADNTIYNGGEQTALTIALPATDTIGFICEVAFSSGSTATTLSYSLTDIFWAGVDVSYDATAQKDIFTPVANKRYTIIFYYDGVNYNGRVGGV